MVSGFGAGRDSLFSRQGHGKKKRLTLLRVAVLKVTTRLEGKAEASFGLFLPQIPGEASGESPRTHLVAEIVLFGKESMAAL